MIKTLRRKFILVAMARCHKRRMNKVQMLSAGHFFLWDFSNRVEIQVLRSPVYRGAARSSASIAWSNSKPTSWFEHSGKLDGDSALVYRLGRC